MSSTEGLRPRLVQAGAFSLMAWGLLHWLSPPVAVPWNPTMTRAARVMATALEVTKAHCRAQNIPMDPFLDPAETCLVGPQLSPLFTTLGQAEAKRTTLNPDLAGLLVHLLQEAGVEAGDTVALGASGSFPGLLVAGLSAAEALESVPIPILSLGASSYGATRPEFHLLDLHRLLNREGIIDTPPAAVSLGGEGDVGMGFPPALRDSLGSEVRGLGIPFLQETSLSDNVTRRMEIYGEPAAFLNMGGAQANLGVSPAILEVPSGLTRNPAQELSLPPENQRGVLFAMAARDIPVIHLLHIRGLALKHGLSWDPTVLPKPGSTRIRKGEPSRGSVFWAVSAVYLLGLFLILAPRGFHRRTVRQRPSTPSFPGMS